MCGFLARANFCSSCWVGFNGPKCRSQEDFKRHKVWQGRIRRQHVTHSGILYYVKKVKCRTKQNPGKIINYDFECCITSEVHQPQIVRHILFAMNVRTFLLKKPSIALTVEKDGFHHMVIWQTQWKCYCFCTWFQKRQIFIVEYMLKNDVVPKVIFTGS